jgi:RecA-family ATPase
MIALAHPSLSGINSGSGSSGNTGWIGTFRTHLYLTTPPHEEGEVSDDDARMLSRKKTNVARRGETIELRWKDGVFVPVDQPTGFVGWIEGQTCERVFLEILEKMEHEHQPVSSNNRSGNYAPRQFARRPERARYRIGDFEHAMQRLFANGTISNEPYGRKNDERYRIVRRRIEGAAA